MNIYSIDIRIVGTAYIKAESEEEARRVFDENYKEGFGGELPTSDRTGLGDLDVSGRTYDDPRLPEFSLSPAVSFFGPADDDGTVEFDLVEENVPESEED